MSLHVYFIQVGEEGPIKIGVAGDPELRLRTLQAGNPIELRILATCPGAHELERDLHERFAAGRIRGEWFAPDTPDLLDVVAEAAAASSDRYVTRDIAAWRQENIETRAVALARNGCWDEAQALLIVPSEDATERA